MRRAWAVVSLLAPMAAFAGDDRPQRRVSDPKLQRGINQAIERGVEFLRRRQQPEGNWFFQVQPQPHMDGGMTALVLYALSASGCPRGDRTLVRGLEWIASHPEPFTPAASHGTYSASLLIMALTRISARVHRVRIHQLADLVASSQNPSDMWTYRLRAGKSGTKERKSRKNRKRPIMGLAGDNSNSQFAILSLWAAQALAGWKGNATTWRRVRDLYRRTQTTKGGWNYRAPQKNPKRGKDSRPGTPTMTAAGLVSYVYATAMLKGGPDLLPGARRDPVARKGLEAFRKLVAKTNVFNNYYAVYSIERVGTVMDLPTREWYEPGARKLLAAQTPDGSWGSVYNTALALLFLSRATSHTITPRPATGRDAFPDLSKPGQTERAFDFYLAYNPRKRAEVVSEFGKAGPQAVGLFISKLDDHRELVRATAYELLRALVDRALFFDPKAGYEDRAIMLRSIRSFWEREGHRLRWDEQRRVFVR